MAKITSATYRIGNIYYYIEYDGYYEGAAEYFYDMITCENRRGGHAERFLRANELAQFSDSHEQHPGANFRYNFSADGALVVYQRNALYEWKLCWNGKIWDFVNQYRKMIYNFSPVTYCKQEVQGLEIVSLGMLYDRIKFRFDDSKEALRIGLLGNATRVLNECWKLLELYRIACDELEETCQANDILRGIYELDTELAKAHGCALDEWRRKHRLTKV